MDTSQSIHLSQKLGEIISVFPGSAEILNRYQIDYCCGGQATLAEALEAKTLDRDLIVKELNAAYEEFTNSDSEYKDWRNEKPTVLIKHILQTHHETTKRLLSEIDPLLFKILKVHYQHHNKELLQVHRLFGALKTELQQHLVKEEEVLFPLIEEYEISQDQGILTDIHRDIKDTEEEHNAAGNILKELERITRNFCAPEGACTSFQLTYNLLNELEKDLFIHIYLENSVLFAKLH
jgi:regulator of cell morphogenesis and NO signaling